MTFTTNHRRRTWMLWLTAAVFLLLTWWHVANLVSDSRTKELAAAERDLANLTRVSQEHADRTFRSADQVIRFIQARYLELGDRLDLTALSKQGVIDTEIFPQVGVIDAQGIYILANRPINGRLDLSDREHFKVHVAADTGELFVSKPVLGRSTGKWSIQLTRRINRPNGDFAGVVVVSIDPGYFTRFYTELRLGTEGIMALYGLDGVARARKVGSKEEFGTQASGSPMFDYIAGGRNEGTYTARSVVDGVERLYHYRKIPRYPLVVVDGIDTEYMLDNHQRAKRALWLQAAIVSFLILVLTAALVRFLTRISDDLAVRQSAQRQIEDRNEQLAAVFALSPDGLVTFDAAHRVKFANPAFFNLTAIPEAEIIGLDEAAFTLRMRHACTISAGFPTLALLRAAQPAGQKVGAGDTAIADNNDDAQVRIELAGPGKRILDVVLRESNAETVSQILYFRDITHESEVDRMKSEFLSTAAHELRTPMASILGYSELILEMEFDAAEHRDFLETIHRSAGVMTHLINELLDLARIEARGNADFNLEPLAAAPLLRAIVADFKAPDQRAQPRLSLPEAELWLRGDRSKLTQAIVNLLSNAYKYSSPGEDVNIEVLHQDSTADSSTLVLQIRDHGIGMTPEQLTHCGERFYRADTSGRVLGAGLGVSIAKEIVELHGGSLEFASAIGQGTTVSLRLPDADPTPSTVFTVTEKETP